ncbi:MAG: hypothetical protein AAGE43_02465 [Pseudomonadota bacterium]
MGFFSFLVLLAIAYLLWRVTDQLPDLIFRMSEIQRDVAELRRALASQETASDASTPAPSTPATTDTSAPASDSDGAS